MTPNPEPNLKTMPLQPGDRSDHELDILQKELDYRRKKQWDIFSWGSTVLLSITGGIFALAMNGKNANWPVWEKGAISLAAITVAVCAQLWIRHHWQHELDLCAIMGESVGYPFFRKKAPVGYPQSLAALTLAALLSIWY